MKLPIVEKFLSIQGEGNNSGQLSYFIRLAKCNLRCKWCDTTYASRIPESSIKMTDGKEIIKELKKIRERNSLIPIIFTGGEPLLHKKEIKQFIKLLDHEMVNNGIEIETNGTIMPITGDSSIGYNISPKLSSSGNNPKKAINLKTLRYFNNHSFCIFKFVIKTDKDWDEMQQIVKDAKIDNDDVFIMPEGTTDAELKKNAKKLIKKVIENGYNFSPRLHVWLWGNKKGV